MHAVWSLEVNPQLVHLEILQVSTGNQQKSNQPHSFRNDLAFEVLLTHAAHVFPSGPTFVSRRGHGFHAELVCTWQHSLRGSLQQFGSLESSQWSCFPNGENMRRLERVEGSSLFCSLNKH